ncbi:DcaP family trimeric outer membrane transporter [Roseiconus lacunae]|uniref:DcaP family trimeric outer membrane transporter n=1 Tax=Roseiconus lacunae TaxID=2605694 RepID=UPI0011F12200|nr:DcaP family trimeric outer membrane transporter [Roseiconus lacunae]
METIAQAVSRMVRQTSIVRSLLLAAIVNCWCGPSVGQDSIAGLLSGDQSQAGKAGLAADTMGPGVETSALPQVIEPSVEQAPIDLDALLQPNTASTSAAGFRTEAFDGNSLNQADNNFTSFPDFSGGIVILGENAALKIGGFIKADFITDFDPIDSEDSFDTTQIPIGAADYENARFHAKQSRLSFDTRWRVNREVARAYIESDFFGGNDGENGSLRLRHAYGTLGRFTVGQTWTTFTDSSAVPQTLDFEGAVSNVNRRQGLMRFTQPLGDSDWKWAVSVEDPTIDIDIPVNLAGQGRTESPDIISHLRFDGEFAETQAAFLVRKIGFQPAGQPVLTGTGWGVNLTGSVHLTECTRVYSQLTVGEGIGSYRGSPDVVSTGPNSAAILPMFGWMIGCKHSWTDCLTSNMTFSQLTLEDLPGQEATNLRRTDYLAVNLIYSPYQRLFGGLEYLYGLRENHNRQQADAHRLQMSFGFYLP